MRKIVKIIYVIGLLFFGGGTIYYTFNLFALNGFGDTFEMIKVKNPLIEIKQDSLDTFIYYEYEVNNIIYSDNLIIDSDVFDNYKTNTITIRYNRLIPYLNYIEEIPIKEYQNKLGIIVFFIPLLFIILLWNFSDREKWFRRYESLGDPPRLSPPGRRTRRTRL